MASGLRWLAASDDALEWIQQTATSYNGAGYLVGPMPDKVHLLHPLQERVDGKPVSRLEGGYWVYPPDHETAPLRPVRWQEYARRRGLPDTVAFDHVWNGRGSFSEVACDDHFVWQPDEGTIDDADTQAALFDVLLRHTAGEGDALCTAFFYWFGAHDPELAPRVMRGPLGAWRELFNRDDRIHSPQNIWPDSHEWVLQTDTDSWDTAISGPVNLVRDLYAAPALEAIGPAKP